MKYPKKKKIALLIETSNAYARGLLSGITRFHHERQDWRFVFPEQQRGATPPAWIKEWDPDGIIARIETESIAEFVRQFDVPTVDVSSARLIEDLPWVETNDQAIGTLAAETLLERGFRNFGYVTDPAFNWSRWRQEGFKNKLLLSQCQTHELVLSSNYDGKSSLFSDFERICQWLKDLPKPIGIMGCYDIRARQVLEACNELGLPVPEQVAVIGVDNDSLICNACNPSLTSIALASQKAGYIAAEMLHRWLEEGTRPQQTCTLLDPIGVEERLSTDTVAIDDPDIAKALEFIRENATYGINVEHVLENCDISRRKLESRFKALVGRTPHQEIQRRRFEKVKYLLRHSELSIANIARNTGFEHPEYLSVAFQKHVGQSPTEYREAYLKQSLRRTET